MKTIALISTAVWLAVSSFAAETNQSSEQVEAKYTAAIEGRTADILKALALTDTNQVARVHDALIAQYRALRMWHEENDAKLKSAKGDTNAIAAIHVSLKKLHYEFLTKLASDLNAAQVELVKDKMTYGKVQFTYKGYLIEYPDMNEAQKAEVLRLLKDAREEAMDGGSSDEKSAIFNRYKGKINNYLSKQGVQPARKKAAANVQTNSVAK
jgi:hypothetical protein